MRGLYYIITALPPLSYKAEFKLPISIEKFLSDIKGFVSKKDYELIYNIISGGNASASFIDKFIALKNNIDGLVLQKRAQKLGRKNISRTQGSDSSLNQTVDNILKAESPLKAEEMLFSLYWDALDTVLGLHKFDIVELCVYAFKLKFLERRTRFDKKNGSDEFDKLVSYLKVDLED